MSNQAPSPTRIPRHAAQMDPQELSPLTTKRGVILAKPRRHDTQVSEPSLARAAAILHSPLAAPLTPGSTSSATKEKVHKNMMMQHFASLDIEMVYDINDEEDRQKERADSMDMADVFYSEH